MMNFLLGMLAGAVLAAGGLWYEYAAPKIAEAQAAAAEALDQKQQIDSKLQATEADLEKAKKDEAEVKAVLSNATVVGMQAAIAAAPAIQAPAPALAGPDPKQAARDAAKGERVGELHVGVLDYQGVIIGAVDPAGIDFRFADGAFRASFEDLDQSWRDRFQYDPAEAKAFLERKAVEANKSDEAIEAELAAQAQAKAAAAPTTAPTTTSNSDANKQIADLQGQLAGIQAKHDEWVAHSQPNYHPRNTGNIPDDISDAAISRIQTQIAQLKGQ